MARFRVHYSLQSVNGTQHHSEAVEAATPDDAAGVIIARLKPRRVSIGKVKRVRDAETVPDANHPYGLEHPLP